MQAQRNTSDSDDDTAEDGERRRQQPTLVVDDWLQMSTDEGRPLQLAVLRARLNYAFAFKVNTSVLCFHVGLNCGDVMHRCAFVIPYLARSHSMASLPHAHAAAGIGPTISESRADDVSIASQALEFRCCGDMIICLLPCQQSGAKMAHCLPAAYCHILGGVGH